jgi:hypothetical protein
VREGVGERPSGDVSGGVDDHPRRLVDHRQLGVLVHHRERQILGDHRRLDHLGELDLDRIAGANFVARARDAAVDQHLARLDPVLDPCPAAPEARRHTGVEALTSSAAVIVNSPLGSSRIAKPGNTSSTIEATINLLARNLEPFDARSARY